MCAVRRDAHESEVGTRLTAGGKRIRTSGPTLKEDQPFRGCHSGFRARLHRMQVIPERDKFEPPASRDDLGSRSWGRLSHPILRMKHQKRGLDMEKLSGKTALVTGSTDGVGRLVARKLGQAGARVLVHGRDAERGARVVARSRPAAEWRRSLPPTSRRSMRCVALPAPYRRRWVGSRS